VHWRALMSQFGAGVELDLDDLFSIEPPRGFGRD
jgi:hypothetical protein